MVRSHQPENDMLKKILTKLFWRYEVCAYETGDALPWGQHKAVTKRQALEWMASYPKGSEVYVFTWDAFVFLHEPKNGRIIASRKA
jgi:hypothetical protein